MKGSPRQSVEARANERGAIAILTALVLTVVMGFAALAFDLSYVRLARMEMKNATDASALAAMVVLRQTRDTTQSRNAAIMVAGKNTVLGIPLALADTDVKFGIWDYDSSTFTSSGTANAVFVNGHNADPSAADGTLNTTFGRTIGFGQANVSQISTASYRVRHTMFEMDITGSLLVNTCSINAAINADMAFLDDMYNAGVVKDKLGGDVFVGGATPFTPLQTLSTNYPTIKSLWHGDHVDSTKVGQTTGLGICQKPLPNGKTTGDFVPCPGSGTQPTWPTQANLGPGIPMPNCWDGDFHYFPTTTLHAGTNIGAGIKSGIDQLQAVPHASEVRAIVIFTDGGPQCCENWDTCCQDGTAPIQAAGAGCVNSVGAYNCATSVYNYGIAQADAAAGAGIDVYVLVFDNPPPKAPHPLWVAYGNSLARGRGFALNTTDPAQLNAKLAQIANNIAIAIVQ